MVWTVILSVVSVAALYSLISVCKPLKPFERRWSAGLAAFFLFAAVNGIGEARMEDLRRTDPAAYQAEVAARKAREAERQRDRQQAQQARLERQARASAARAERERCGDEIEALTYAREAVKRRLKAPATADFPWANDKRVQRLGCGRFVVREYVDAQNAFGANVRSHYAVTMRMGTNAWYAEDVQIW